MNPISKTHKRFSLHLNDPRVLTNPEEFLGPNYKEVLKFWMILDDLSEDQLRVINKRYEALCNENPSEWRKAVNFVAAASKEVVGMDYAINAGWAAYEVTKSYAADWATRELIGMHLILDQEKPLTFFEMFLGGYDFFQ